MLKGKVFGFILLALFAVSAQTVIYKYTKEQKASYASFAAYLTAVGTTKTSWEMGKDVAIAATTHIQSNIDIRTIMSQAKFTGASNLYIGRMSAKSENQIFDTSLTVFFDTGSVSDVCVHWFGNSKAAFRRANNSAATNGLAISVAKYQYPIVGKVSVTSSVDITSFSKSAMLKGNTGSGTDTLVIARMSAKPEYQIFDTSLVVIFNKNAVAYVDRKWFGSDARFNTARDSIRVCVNGDKVIIDTLRGNTNIDSISGHPVIDSVKFGNTGYTTGDWIDYTSTSTITGWVATPSQSIKYMRFGNSCMVNFSISGTSNSTAATFTLPLKVSDDRYLYPCAAGDSITEADSYSEIGWIDFDSDSLAVRVIPSYSSSWPNHGSKLVSGSFVYLLKK